MMVTWSHHEIRSTEPRDDRDTGARLKGSAKALDIWRMETKIEAMAAGFSGPAAGDNMSFWPQHLYHWCQLQVFDIVGPHVCCALTNCNQTTIVRFP